MTNRPFSDFLRVHQVLILVIWNSDLFRVLVFEFRILIYSLDMNDLQRNNHNLETLSYFRKLGSAFVVIGILLFGCVIADDERDIPRTTKKELSMAQTSETAVPAALIPPIDAVAYAGVETATFALG